MKKVNKKLNKKEIKSFNKEETKTNIIFYNQYKFNKI